MTETKLPVRDKQKSSIRKLKWSEAALHALREAIIGGRVVLFTPAVPPFAQRTMSGPTDVPHGGSTYPPKVDPGQSTDNVPLQDYQMRLRLLEQQSKTRLLKARQVQDGMAANPLENKLPIDSTEYTGRTSAQEDAHRSKLAVDPFECLGQTLALYGAGKLCHVPFVSSVGFTETHRHWARQASAIIVINCEPAASDDATVKLFLAKQQAFASAVFQTRVLENHSQEYVPLVFIHCGSGDIVKPEGYDVAIQASTYSRDHLVEAGHSLMDV